MNHSIIDGGAVLHLHPGRLRLIGLWLICATFVLVGVWMLRDGAMMGWLVAGFFAMGVAIFPFTLFARWNSLRLDAQSFGYCALWRRGRWRWSEIETFKLVNLGAGPQLAFTLKVPPAAWMRAA